MKIGLVPAIASLLLIAASASPTYGEENRWSGICPLNEGDYTLTVSHEDSEPLVVHLALLSLEGETPGAVRSGRNLADTLFGTDPMEICRLGNRSRCQKPFDDVQPAAFRLHSVGMSNAMDPIFSIITTCKGRLGHLRRTLPAMLDQPGVEVVDDCPEGTAS